MKDFIKDPDPETDINLGSFSILIFDWVLVKTLSDWSTNPNSFESKT